VAIGFAQTSSFLLFFGDSRISPFSLLITPSLKIRELLLLFGLLLFGLLRIEGFPEIGLLRLYPERL
jgi:hypothetical protein